jgi:hypothetical protein
MPKEYRTQRKICTPIGPYEGKLKFDVNQVCRMNDKVIITFASDKSRVKEYYKYAMTLARRGIHYEHVQELLGKLPWFVHGSPLTLEKAMPYPLDDTDDPFVKYIKSLIEEIDGEPKYNGLMNLI